MKKQKWISCILVAVLLTLTGCRTELKAAEYVQANLDLTFQGETGGAQEFVTASKDDLEKVYKNGIYAFVESYLTNGIDDEGIYTNSFAYLTEEIFRAMRYQIGETREVDRTTYEVDVKYQPVNIFTVFVEKVKELSKTLEQRLESGYYEGTEEEQQKLMLIDYVETSYQLLGEAYLQLEYEEPEIFTFTVTKGTGNVPKLGEKEMNKFIECILALDKL